MSQQQCDEVARQSCRTVEAEVQCRTVQSEICEDIVKQVTKKVDPVCTRVPTEMCQIGAESLVSEM